MRATCALLAIFPIAVHAGTITVNDDRSNAIVLAAPAQRIVALAPSLTELVFAAGAGSRLVGVARFSDYPSAAKNIPLIGDASRIDLERVLSLAPDLIVGWKSGNQIADLDRLEQLGFKVYVAEPDTLTAISKTLRSLGALAGTTDAAQRATFEFERGIAALRAQYGTRRTVPVFYEIWHMPLMTVNGRHVISDVIRLCGGENVFASVPVLAPVVSLESVLAAHPAGIIGGSSATTPEEFAGQWRRYASFAQLAGVPTLYVHPDLIQRQSPRILYGARVICEQLESIRSNHR